jgi:hypothetical protein
MGKRYPLARSIAALSRKLPHAPASPAPLAAGLPNLLSQQLGARSMGEHHSLCRISVLRIPRATRTPLPKHR